MADRKPSVSTSRTTAGNGAAGDTSAGTTSAQTTTAINTRSTSPYGTRSRGRGARINYAEDKDNDMDYEFTSTPSTSSSKSAAAVEPAPSTNASRRASAVGTGAKDKEAVKENTATVAATTTTSGSKKRKSAHPAPIMPKDITLSNMMSFRDPYLKDGNLIADDGTSLAVNDHIYLVCEPPGEPYYLARIMEFLHTSNDPSLPIDSIRVNWYYRPKDIQRKVTDTRVLFASMHSDSCPLAAVRGKCFISHRSEVKDVDEYRKQRDSFYFEKMFDRYIHRYYDVIPTTMVRNVPEKVRKVLVERWKYLLVEPQRAKELCSQMKECKRCSGYCATTDSVHCAVCGHTYHMNCVRPPLLKKPSRGFAWACGPCNQAQERKLEARNTPNLTPGTGNGNDLEDDVFDDEEEDLSPRAVPSDTATPSETADHDKQPTPEQLHWARMWPMRYLGQHCRVEDALDYDDRIYPRAASRIGPRHQANVNPWHGRPVEYVKPVEKKKPQKGGSKSAKNAAAAAAEAEAAAERERRPKWVMDEPVGYIRRGEDDGSTSTLLFKMPDLPEDEEGDGETEKKQVENEEFVDRFTLDASEIAKTLPGGGVEKWTVNFQDKAIELLYANDFDEKKALTQLGKMHVMRDLKEPRFKPDEHKRFEEGVAKFGSELHAVTKNVKTRKTAEIVRYYYTWKKTAKGREIWGNFEGRKGKKEVKVRDKEHGTKLVDDVADDDDDSAFDNTKAGERKRGFECKFCNTRESRQWRRAPGVQPGTLIADRATASSRKKGGEERWLVSALCRRCAELWRRYGIQWEDPDEIQKKISQGGGRAWKRRIDEEMLKEMTAAQADEKAEAAALAAATAFATPTPPVLNGTPVDTQDEKREPARKKQKTEVNGSSKKGKERERAEKKEPPPPPPEPPKPKLLPCGICEELEPLGDQHLVCRDCKMSVHKACYGVGEQRGANKWVCEMCANDKNPTVSTNYECVLCPCHGFTDHEDGGVGASDKDLASKGSAKKKIPGEKDKPIINNHGSHEDGRKVKEIDKRRPKHPREPLKKTSGNNWAHVVCAVWTPETKFAEAKTMKIVEGIGTIPVARWLQTCKICESTGGACVECHACHESVHVGCAHKAGWRMGFDIQPVKGSRRDQVNIVRLGNDTGSMTAAIWCPEHDPKTIHTLNEISEETGQNALQLYTTTYKQADLTLTGTVRKANLMTISTKASQSHRRNSAGGPSASGMANGKELACSPTTVYIKTEGAEDKVGGIEGLLDDHVGGDEPKRCSRCQTDVSPLWRKVTMDTPRPTENTAHLTNGALQPAANGVLTNGDASLRSRTVGLLCHRCQNKDQKSEQSQHSPPFAATNGHQRSRYAPLPPLSAFLASQQAAAPPPPPPPAPHPVMIQGAGPSGVPQPMPLIAPQLVPQMAPIPQHHPHPPPPQALPPHPHQQGHAPPPTHMSPHQPHISSHPTPSHVVPHPPQPPHALPHHPPPHMPPHPPHVSPTRQHVVGVPHIPPHQHSIHPMSPRQHQMLPMSPHAPHLRSHPPPPHPVSHPPHQQSGMQVQPQPQGPPQPPHVQPPPPQPQQPHPPPPPQPQPRPLASASESPALANLLS